MFRVRRADSRFFVKAQNFDASVAGEVEGDGARPGEDVCFLVGFLFFRKKERERERESAGGKERRKRGEREE